MTRRVVKLGLGGTLPTVIAKLKRNFRPRNHIREGKATKDVPGKYAFLASHRYPLMMALIRSLDSNSRPVVVDFTLDRRIMRKSKLYLTLQGPENDMFIPDPISFDDLLEITDTSYSPMGCIKGGIIVGSLPMEAVTRIIVGKKIDTAALRHPENELYNYLERILGLKSKEERIHQLWNYLVQWSFIESNDQVAHRLIKDFEMHAAIFSLRGFKACFCSNK